MSKICLLVISSLGADLNQLKTIIEQQVVKSGYGVFFSVDYYEPAIEHYKESSLICSISDSAEFDNCEKFLLADNCYINGIRSEVPFYDRMKWLTNIIDQIICLPARVELFIGESGTSYEDFEEVYTSVPNFPIISERLINNSGFHDLHFVFV